MGNDPDCVNSAPEADAGPNQTRSSGSSVSLSVLASTDANIDQTLTYSWTQIGSPTVSLTGANTATPSFTAPTLGAGDPSITLIFRVTVSDGITSDTALTSVTITSTPNTPPTAHAGIDQSYASGSSVSLDGSGSSANDAGQSLSFAWVQTAGPAVTLAGADTATPGFTAPTLAIGAPDATLTFRLTVDDGFGGNSDSVTITVTAPLDTTRPTVAILGAPGSIRAGSAFQLTLSFSEPVLGMVSTGVSVQNGQVTAFSGSGDSYAVTIRAAGSGVVRVSVPAGVAADPSGNENLPSEPVAIQDTTVQITQDQMSHFMQSRATQLAGHQPDLIALYRQEGRGELNAQVTRGSGSLRFSTRPSSPVWASLSASWTQDGPSDSRYAHLSLGRHVAMSPTLSFGAMLQIDHVAYDTGSASIAGTGWLAGPYLVGRLPDHPLFFSAHALYGETRNRHSPFGTYSDIVETRRRLFSATVAGDMTLGRVTLTPSLRATYISDRQGRYTDSLGNPIPAQSISSMTASLGFDAALPLPTQRGDVTLRGGLSLIHSRSSSTGAAAATIPATEGTRGAVRAGFDFLTRHGATWSFDANYDGVGSSGFGSYGLTLTYNHRF
jgi:hypothetical protein